MSALLVFVGMYGAGIGASLSPCSLPLLPGWVGVVVDGADGSARARRVASFAAGAVGTFAALGSLTAVGTGVLDASRVMQRVSGGLLIVGALASIATAQGRWSREWRLHVPRPSSPTARALALGIGCGTAWTPCVGPLLGAALTAAANGGAAWRGALLLAAFGGGSVTPFVALSAVPSRRVPSSWRPVGRAARRVAPVVFVALGVLLLSGRYDEVVQRLPIST